MLPASLLPFYRDFEEHTPSAAPPYPPEIKHPAHTLPVYHDLGTNLSLTENNKSKLRIYNHLGITFFLLLTYASMYLSGTETHPIIAHALYLLVAGIWFTFSMFFFFVFTLFPPHYITVRKLNKLILISFAVGVLRACTSNSVEYFHPFIASPREFSIRTQQKWGYLPKDEMPNIPIGIIHEWYQRSVAGRLGDTEPSKITFDGTAWDFSNPTAIVDCPLACSVCIDGSEQTLAIEAAASETSEPTPFTTIDGTAWVLVEETITVTVDADEASVVEGGAEAVETGWDGCPTELPTEF